MRARGLIYGVAFSLLLWCIIILGLSQCITTKPRTDLPDNIKSALQQADSVRTATIGTQQAPVTTSRSHILYALQSCKPAHGANPWVYLPDQNPVVGSKLRCTLLQSYCFPRKNNPFLVVLADHLLPGGGLDLTPYGAPGCQMVLPLQTTYILSPGDKLDSFSYYGDGMVDVAIDIPVSFAGKKMYLQAAVFAQGENTSGLLVTQVVEWWIPTL